MDLPPPRELLDTGFGDDSGAASPDLVEALAAYARDPKAYVDALDELRQSRLLVPVVAVLGEVEVGADGLARDKSSDMAAVLLRGADGRLALLAFTSTETLARWNPEARPVPVTADLAAQAALQDDAAALVVDVAGPTTLVVEGDDLRGLASRWVLTRAGDRPAWIGPAPE
ncbi:SseB family protein [Nocardioides sp. KIGAM211]|uniref:SseB family protein n=1 Tax=Nocardioides luti TaxID=2761101 RepID=A0A7X0RLT2_9ACTN|nr:SseB family protein [Nocardioides luti]MBB6629434.1 SseB family protein [Nocardioides luti]